MDSSGLIRYLESFYNFWLLVAIKYKGKIDAG